ncbi:hypothetical protein ACFX16_015453 [Malus domestica]
MGHGSTNWGGFMRFGVGPNLLRKATKQILKAFLLGNDPLNEDAHVLVVDKARAVKAEFDQVDDGEVNEWAKDLGWAWGQDWVWGQGFEARRRGRERCKKKWKSAENSRRMKGGVERMWRCCSTVFNKKVWYLE